jgi:hypothetical protein
MVPHAGRDDGGQAASYPLPDRLARKPSLDSVAELAVEDDVDGLEAQQIVSNLPNSHGQVRNSRRTEARAGHQHEHMH